MENSHKKSSCFGLLKKASVVLVSLAAASIMVAMPTLAASTGNWQDSGNVATSYLQGSGSISAPYQIATAGQLAFLAEQVNAGNGYYGDYFVLKNNINLSGKDWTPIGTLDDDFNGNFDGGGHEITGLTIGTAASPNSTLDVLGLFGVVCSGTIKNVGVNSNIYSSYSSSQDNACVGAIVGVDVQTNITKCYSYGTISASGDSSMIGGLVGANSGEASSDVNSTDNSAENENLSNVTGSYSECTVLGGDGTFVGGLVGVNDIGTIQNCYATGSVSTGDDSCSGGLIASNVGNVFNCYSTGSVSSGDESVVGGFVGNNGNTVSNCYSTGIATGGNDCYVGGFSGCEDTSVAVPIISSGYWNSAAAIYGVGNGADNSTQMSLSSMQNSATSQIFVATLNSNITSLSLTGSDSWKYVLNVNNGYPVIDGVGVGVSISKIAVNTPTKALYGKGQALNVSGAVITVTYSDGTTASVPVTSSMVGAFDSSTGGTKTVTVSYLGFKTSFLVTVDVTPPTIGTVKLSISTITNKNITATVSVAGGTKSTISLSITKNGSYSFTATDSVGNTATKTFKVSNIDKTAPAIKANVANNSKIHGKATVTVTDTNLNSKTIQRGGKTIAWGTGAYTTKGKYVVTATDKAGNKSTYTFTIY